MNEFWPPLPISDWCNIAREAEMRFLEGPLMRCYIDVCGDKLVLVRFNYLDAWELRVPWAGAA